MTQQPERPLPDGTRLVRYDLVAADEISEAVGIWPCTRCSPWHLEVRRRETDGELAVVEWHDEDCEHLRSLLADDAAADGALPG